MTRSAESILKDGTLDTREIRPRENLVVSDTVLTTDAKVYSELHLLEPFQTFDVN